MSNETETVRVYRVRREPIATWGPWQLGPLPSRDTFDEIDIKWALIAVEPMDSTGNAPSPGDQLIGFIESQKNASAVIAQHVDGYWMCHLVYEEESGTDVEGHGDTVVEAIQAALAGASAE